MAGWTRCCAKWKQRKLDDFDRVQSILASTTRIMVNRNEIPIHRNRSLVPVVPFLVVAFIVVSLPLFSPSDVAFTRRGELAGVRLK